MARMPCRTSCAAQMRDAIKELTGEALDAFEAGQHGNTRWTLRKLLVDCTLRSWHEGQTLTSRFEHLRELLATMFPGWAPPGSYSGLSRTP